MTDTKDNDLWCRPRKDDRHQRLSSYLDQLCCHETLETGGFHSLHRQATKICRCADVTATPEACCLARSSTLCLKLHASLLLCRAPTFSSVIAVALSLGHRRDCLLCRAIARSSSQLFFLVAPDTACSAVPGHHPRPCMMPPSPTPLPGHCRHA
jgi:hypothetical protein